VPKDQKEYQLWKVDRIRHCKVNPIMRKPEALLDSFCDLGTVVISTARNHVRSSEIKRINAGKKDPVPSLKPSFLLKVTRDT